MYADPLRSANPGLEETFHQDVVEVGFGHFRAFRIIGPRCVYLETKVSQALLL